VIRLAVRAPEEAAEPVLAALVELAPAGLEQVDGPGWVEFVLYGEACALPLGPGSAELGGARVAVRAEEVADDWADRWRGFHRPVLVGGRLWVRPPWEAPGRPGVEDVVVDPGRAFGTGAHPTTRGCLELLLELPPRGALADAGCGSGVLAIAAARLGFAPVTAWDIDPAALDATRANADLNRVRLDGVALRDLRADGLPDADVVVANLTRPLLLELAARPKRPRVLIASGVLEREAAEVARAFGPLEERRRLASEGWATLRLERPRVRKRGRRDAGQTGEARPGRAYTCTMTLEERLKADIAAGLKAGDRQRVHALRLVLSELQKAHKEARDGADEPAVLRRERKRRLEAADAYAGAGRDDLAAAERFEAELIEGYLPAQLSEAELQAIVGDAVAETGASSPKEMGKVMSVVMARVEGRADGKRVSGLVREKLTA
jgi:ribosomal protein L11 methyltransferase